MTPERYSKICRVLNQRQPDLTVIADEVHKGRNLSAIVRTCDAVGVDTLHCVIPKKGYRPYRGTAMGSQKWVEVESYETLEAPCIELKRQGFQVVAAHPGEQAAYYGDIDYTRPTALLLGTEKQGVSATGMALADQLIRIPMMGMVESFNVSVACAIVLNEAQKQRQEAGLYNKRRLPEAEYRRRLFRWAHPVLTAFCDKHSRTYPELDEEGEVLHAAEWHQRVRLNGYR